MFFIIKLYMFIREKSENQMKVIKKELLKHHSANSLQIFIFFDLAWPLFGVRGQKWHNSFSTTEIKTRAALCELKLIIKISCICILYWSYKTHLSIPSYLIL